MNDNQLSIHIYSAYSTTLVVDVGDELRRATGLQFATAYPHGLYSTCSFFIPRDVTAGWQFKGGQRVVIRNGLTVVWEGALADEGYEVGSGAEQGRGINAVGYWGWLLGRRGIHKPWADIRIDEATWPFQTGTTGDGSEQCGLDRLSRLRFTPKAVAWANGDYASVRYTAPTGQTIKRLTYTEELQEGAQAWKVSLYNVGTAAEVVTRTTSGSGAIDHTLATPSQSVELRFVSLAAQTPAADGTIFGQFSGLTLYTETGSINAQEIAKDLRAVLTANLNSDESRIGALTLSLVPFITDGHEYIADTLARAAAFGDASFNAWAVYVDHSESAATPDGKPPLVLEQDPPLTDYDVAIHIGEPNLVAPFALKKDYFGIKNYIRVKYRDMLDNRDVFLTPEDDATLKDQASIDEWGYGTHNLDAGLSTSTLAINLARRVLAAESDPRFYMSSAVRVVGTIRGKNGNLIPASEVKAGMRLRVEDFLNDEVGVDGAGLTFLITGTSYDDASRTVSMTTGTPDDLAVMLAQLFAEGVGV